MNFLQAIFLSPDEPRLRAGWRLLIQSIPMLVLMGCVSLPVLLIPGVNQNWELFLLLLQVIEFITVTASVFLARRFLDRRSFSSLGLIIDRRAFFDLLTGIAITFLMMGLIYLIEWQLGWLTFLGFARQLDPAGLDFAKILMVFLVYVLVGWSEELLSRGYHLQNLTEGLNRFWGVVLSSLIFGVSHLSNPNVSLTGVIGIFLAGVFLAYAYLRTRQLWLPIGLHIGWNFFEGVVFGFPVSGMNTYRLVRTAIDGPVTWTGGAFGPEGGLVLIPALLVGILLIFVYAQNRRGDEDNTQDEIELI